MTDSVVKTQVFNDKPLQSMGEENRMKLCPASAVSLSYHMISSSPEPPSHGIMDGHHKVLATLLLFLWHTGPLYPNLCHKDTQFSGKQMQRCGLVSTHKLKSCCGPLSPSHWGFLLHTVSTVCHGPGPSPAQPTSLQLLLDQRSSLLGELPGGWAAPDASGCFSFEDYSHHDKCIHFIKGAMKVTTILEISNSIM